MAIVTQLNHVNEEVKIDFFLLTYFYYSLLGNMVGRQESCE